MWVSHARSIIGTPVDVADPARGLVQVRYRQRFQSHISAAPAGSGRLNDFNPAYLHVIEPLIKGGDLIAERIPFVSGVGPALAYVGIYRQIDARIVGMRDRVGAHDFSA